VEEAKEDPELEGEIRDECAKCGPVELVKLVLVEEENAVRVFVLFADTAALGGLEAAAASAEKARASLHSRYFGGRVVTGELYDHALFLAGNFLA
jgi:hypothetical protein